MFATSAWICSSLSLPPLGLASSPFDFATTLTIGMFGRIRSIGMSVGTCVVVCIQRVECACDLCERYCLHLQQLILLPDVFADCVQIASLCFRRYWKSDWRLEIDSLATDSCWKSPHSYGCDTRVATCMHACVTCMQTFRWQHPNPTCTWGMPDRTKMHACKCATHICCRLRCIATQQCGIDSMWLHTLPLTPFNFGQRSFWWVRKKNCSCHIQTFVQFRVIMRRR